MGVGDRVSQLLGLCGMPDVVRLCLHARACMHQQLIVFYIYTGHSMQHFQGNFVNEAVWIRLLQLKVLKII